MLASDETDVLAEVVSKTPKDAKARASVVSELSMAGCVLVSAVCRKSSVLSVVVSPSLFSLK